ncbi:MAG TPA: TonB-dependent receptor [Vicinamibacterales bacterium]|nr:TonB-dependent receptor [Vicinamibacterales bacterium]
MKQFVRFLAVIGVLAVAAAPAIAQVQTGSILVKAVDQQGATVPGASVTISSSVLPGGTMAGVTDAGGVYRFPSLPPGTYQVKVELQGFKTLVREGIDVLVGQTTPIDFSMNVATVAETVTVAGTSPTIDTTSANVNVNLSSTLLQETPGGRDLWGLLEAKVPGLSMSRPDVAGTSGGLQGGFSARGTTASQNTLYLNGVNVGDPAAIGFAGFYYDFDSLEDVQVSTGAHDITVPTGGVFLNMVTKSGGDHWAGSGTFTWLSDSTQARNDHNPTLQKYGIRPDSDTANKVSDANITGGGPLTQDKLRFFGTFRDWRVGQNVPVQNSQVVLDQTNITNGLGNVTWQLNGSNRITGLYSYQRYSKPNRLLNNSSITVIDSTSDEEDRFHVAQGLWNSVIGKNLFIDARLAINKILFPTYQNGGNQQSTTDNATGIVYGNFPTNTVRHRDRDQFNGTANYYVDNALGARHELKFGFDYSHAVTTNENTRVDNVTTTYTSASGVFVPQNVTLFATPQNDVSAVNLLALFWQDNVTVKRLTVTGGLRYEHLEGYLPPQNSPASPFAAAGIGGFAAQPRSFPEQRGIVLWNNVAPRIAAVFDLTGDGKTAAKASAARYLYVLSTGGGGVSNVNPNANYSEQYTWNDLNGDHKFEIGEQSGVPVVSAVVVNGQIATSIDPNFSRPYTNEYSFGIDREVMANTKFSAVVTYRQEKNIQASINPDNPYASTLTSAVDPGIDGVVGTADDGTYGFYARTSALNRTVITNDTGYLQTYKGLELTMNKRLSNRWQLLVGYTLAKTEINSITAATNPNVLINATGNVTDTNAPDRPNQFKSTGMYVLPWQNILISGNLSIQQGPPITRQISRAVGFATNQIINLEPLGNTRLDTLTKIDLRVGKQFRFASNRSVEASIDFDNITNADTVWSARNRTEATAFTDPTTGTRATLQQFLSPVAILAPRTVVFRAAFKF